MAAGIVTLLLVATLCYQDTQGTTGTPPPTDAGVNHSNPADATTRPTTQAGEEAIRYMCPASLNTWHTCAFALDCARQSRQRYCNCDQRCVRYGDCCPDFEETCRANATGAGATPASGHADADADVRCVQTEDFDPRSTRPRSGYRLVAVCPPDWTGPGASAITQLCRETSGMEGLAAVPVKGSDGRHYRNVYCAMCHGLAHTNLTFWHVSYQSTGLYTRQPLNISTVYQIVVGHSQGSGRAFRRFFEPPAGVDYLAGRSLRTCSIVDAVSFLIDDSRRQEVCRRYYAPISWNGTTYRNLACLEHDGAPARTVYERCESARSYGRGGTMITLLIFSDRTDIDTNLHPFGSLGDAAGCTHRQVYDPLSSSCRDLTCPDGFALEDGGARCRRIIREAENGSAGPRVDYEVALAVAVSLDKETVDNRNATRLSEIWEEIANQAAQEYRTIVSVGEFESGMTQNTQFGRQNTTRDSSSVRWTCDIGVTVVGSTSTCLSGSVFKCNVNVSFNSLALSDNFLIAQNEGLSSQCFASRIGNHTMRPDYLVLSTPCKTPPNDTEAESDFNQVFASKLAYLLDNSSGRLVVSQNHSCSYVLLDCPLLTFSKKDYVIAGALNDSIRLTAHNRVLDRGEFQMKVDGGVVVCNFLQQGAPPATPPARSWGRAHFILGLAGSSLSLVGLVVTIATYVVFPTLRRTVAGWALMSLVGALFLAQLTVLVGLDRTDLPILCVVFAISSHFFWLSAFFWMNILAVDIYRTFGIGTSFSVNSDERSFLRYALYGWGAPGLIVATVAILSFCDCAEVDVRYGSAHACWVGNGTANLLSFGVPVIVILCANAVLFCLTVAGIKKTQMASKRMNITQGQSGSAVKRPNNNLILYLKLSAIMGFTWVFGFVASFSGVEFFWFPYITLTSLQGALVCLAFVCNRRVLAMWRARLLQSRRARRCRGDQSDNSGPSRGAHQTSPRSSVAERCRVEESGIQTTRV